jgi:hypothetical protein
MSIGGYKSLPVSTGDPGLFRRNSRLPDVLGPPPDGESGSSRSFADQLSSLREADLILTASNQELTFPPRLDFDLLFELFTWFDVLWLSPNLFY